MREAPEETKKCLRMIQTNDLKISDLNGRLGE